MNRRQLNKTFALVLAFVLSVGLLPVRASAANVTFTDVPTGAWYYSDVTTLANSGIIDGVGNNRFAPENNISNAEMVKLVINSCFRSEYEAYEAQHSAEMQTHFSGANQKYWFSFMCYYARQIGLLNGPSTTYSDIMDIDSYASCYTPMTRYDMALILTNALKLKGIAATDAEKSAVESQIKDLSDIPVAYRDAVKTCYALKTKNAAGDVKSLIEGSNGYFSGTANMTRAQACAVIIRLEYLVDTRGTTSPSDPGPGTTPTTPTGEKEIAVTTSSESDGTISFTVADNKCGTGYLNNGKEINEANVTELLLKAKEIWPTGMSWGYGTETGTHWYKNPGYIVTSMFSSANLGTTAALDSNKACGGFAAMLSDYLFGSTHNPYRKVTNFSDLRPGDVIYSKNWNVTSGHAMVVIGKVTSGSRTGAVYVTSGNSGLKVNWANNGNGKEWPDNSLSQYYALTEDYFGDYVAFTRWPTSGTSGTPTTSAPSDKEIAVTTSNESDGTIAFTVADNNFANGYLNNGKEINEANVTELLLKAKEVWPTGMSWGYGTESGTHKYKNIGYIIGGVIQRNTACSGYAAMLSDYLFGKTHNPVRQVTNFADLRPGDIIVSTTLDHTVVVVGKVTSGTRAGAVYATEGNNSLKVKWANNGTKEWPDTGLSQNYALTEDYFGTYMAYTRYPASGTSGTPTSPVTSAKEIAVTSESAANNSTRYSVADNNFPTGYLNNGKEINEANIKELLLKATTIWPQDMTWGEGTTSGDNWYYDPSTISGSTLGISTSVNYACGGFAAMISDYLFGRTNNPAHAVTNFADLRPGDVIFSTTKHHAMVVIDKIDSGTRAGAVYVVSGNVGGKVSWPSNGTKTWPDTLSPYYAYLEDYFGTYVAYSRYPN